jgi:uncharacterized protein (TIGR02597 family)
MRHSLHPFAIVTFLSILGWLGNVEAQTVATYPVGAITLTLKGGSDTHVSLPFHRPVALETQAQSISGNVTAATITVSASANLTASQFVYVAGSQTNTYYLQFTSGSRNGMYYTVTTNDGSTITVDPNGDAGLVANVNSGDTFRVIPYWTLNTLFPSGQGLYTSPSLTPQSSILIPPGKTAGINLSAAGIYYYYTGTGGPAWLKLGDFNLYPDVTLPPDAFFIVRHPVSVADTQLLLVGNVPMSSQSIIVNNLAPNTPQDNSVALPVPIPVTLAASGLSSVLAPSPSLTPTDELLVFDPTVVAQNKSATAIYYYYTGPGGPLWLLQGDQTFSAQDNQPVFQPGYGYLLRRAPQATASSSVWTFTPPYLSTLNN